MGKLYVVGTPIGNLNDFSKSAIDTLNSVDLIACEDTRVSINLLRHFNIKKQLVAYHKFNEKGKSLDLVKEILDGKNIAVISDAGCPCISDPGSVIARECIEAGIEVIGIPGPSAVITSLMVSGFDIDSFTFYGFLERDNKHIQEGLERIKNDSSKISVIYESPKRLIKTLEKINEILDNPKITVCNDLTKKFEKKYYGNTVDVIKELNENANHELGEYVIVIEKEQVKKEQNELSIEAMLIDKIVKEKVTMKEAIKLVSDESKISKTEVYNASLNIKKVLGR